MEISIILDNKVVYEKEFKSITENYHSLVCLFHNKNLKYIYSIITGVTISVCANQAVYAKDLSEVSNKLRNSTTPIVDVFASLGYPLTYGMFVIGMFMIITGKKSKGLDIIKWAIIGYIGLQFIPFFLCILADIGKELRSSL